MCVGGLGDAHCPLPGHVCGVRSGSGKGGGSETGQGGVSGRHRQHKAGGWRGGGEVGAEGRRKGWGGSGSWSDVAVADFLEALLQMREEDRRRRYGEGGAGTGAPPAPKVRSRL